MGLAAAGATAVWCAPASAPFFPPSPLRSASAHGSAVRELPSHSTTARTPKGTPAVLELLAQRDATATFFLVGEQVERYAAHSPPRSCGRS